jgi:type IV pilus assembly protein PilM
MFGASSAWGLDVGSSTVKAVKLERVGHRIEVVDFDVIEIEHSDDETTRDLRNSAAMAELVRRKKFGQIPVVVSVAGNQVFFRPFSLPAVGDKKVPEIVSYEARQQVPFALEEVVWDYRVAQVPGSAELQVSLVAIRHEIIDGLLSSLAEHNLNIVGITPSPVAILNYVSFDIQPGETFLVLDAGAKVTDFAIQKDGSFWFRPLPVAGDDLTRVFEQKFRMPFAEAEGLKTKLADSKQYEKMFQVLEPSLRSLAGEITRTSGYYLSLQRNAKIERVFGTGHAFRLPGMADFISGNTEMELEMIMAPQRISVSSSIDTAWFAEEFTGMGAATGLALQGLGEAVVDLLLLPAALVRKRRGSFRRKLFSVAALAIGGLVASQWASAKYAVKGLDGSGGRNAKMQQVLEATAGKIKRAEKLDGNLKKPKENLDRWSKIGAERGMHSRILKMTFKTLAAHNAKMREGKPEGGLVSGETFLSELVISKVLSNKDVGEINSDSAMRQVIGRTCKDGYFVAARFESYGDINAVPYLAVDELFKNVKGFNSIFKKDLARPWYAGNPRLSYLAQFNNQWREKGVMSAKGVDNGWPFWLVWVYDPAETSGPGKIAFEKAGGNK